MDFEKQIADGRIKDAVGARELADQFVQEDDRDQFQRARIKGLIDGNPPYDDAKLRKMGQSWRCNLNFRGAEGILNTMLTSYWDLIMEVNTLVYARIRATKGKTGKPDPEAQEYAQVVAEEYTDTLTDWPDFYFNMLTHQTELLRYGVGPIIFPDPIDWRYRSIRRAQFFVPFDTEARVGDLVCLVLRHSYKAHELYDLVKDGESSKEAYDAGWHPDTIKMAILDSLKSPYDTNDRYAQGRWLSLQQEMKNNDIRVSYISSNPVRTYRIFQLEMDKTVTEIVVSETQPYPNFLFYKKEQYKTFDRFINTFLMDTGDGWMRSVKGYGHRIFNHEEVNNRFLNVLVDGGMISSSLLLGQQAGQQGKKLSLNRWGPIVQLPEGATPLQNNMFPNLQAPMNIARMLKENEQANIGVHNQRVEGDSDQPISATQVNYQASREAKVEKSQIALYYVQWDRLHREVYRRLNNPDYAKGDPGYDEAMDFRDRCKARGVPAEYLGEKRCKLFATRSIGMGSRHYQLQATAEIFAARGSLSEEGNVNAIRDFLAARAGGQSVDRYQKPFRSEDYVTQAQVFAVLENNDFAEGRRIPVAIDQNHVIHLRKHFGNLMGEIHNLQKGQARPDQVYVLFVATLQHTAGHLSYLQRDTKRKAIFKQFSELQKQSSGVMKKLQATVQKMQKDQQAQRQQQAEMLQQAAQGQNNPEMVAKLLELRQEFELDKIALAGKQQLAEAKAAHSMFLKDQKVAREIQIMMAKHAATVGAE